MCACMCVCTHVHVCVLLTHPWRSEHTWKVRIRINVWEFKGLGDRRGSRVLGGPERAVLPLWCVLLVLGGSTAVAFSCLYLVSCLASLQVAQTTWPTSSSGCHTGWGRKTGHMLLGPAWYQSLPPGLLYSLSIFQGLPRDVCSPADGLSSPHVPPPG